jgi:hypothetical protein
MRYYEKRTKNRLKQGGFDIKTDFSGRKKILSGDWVQGVFRKDTRKI